MSSASVSPARSTRRLLGPGLVIPALAAALAAPASPDCPPQTPRAPVSDTYQSVQVADEYRWLEDGSDPKVRAWSDAQNACARASLEGLAGRDLLVKRLTTLEGGASPDYFDIQIVKGTIFAMKSQPPKQQPFVVAMKSADDPAGGRVVVDPNRLDPRGTTAIDWYVASPDGRRVAVSLSVGGSEDGTVHVFEVASGKQVYETIARAQEGTGGGALVWDRDGSGFYYTRYPRGAERPKEDLNFFQQVYHHTLGTPEAKDTYAIGKDWPRIAETTFERREDGAWILARVANGDGGEFAFYLLGPAGTWSRVADFADQVKDAAFGPGDALYLRSTKDAQRGQVLRVSLAAPDISQATVVVPQSEAVVVQCLPTATRLYVRDLLGGPYRVRAYDLDGKALGEVPIPELTTVRELHRLGKDDLLFGEASYLTPPAWYRYDAGTGKIARTALAQTSPADFSDTQVVRTTATSKDGTEVPLTILMLKGTPLDGNNPTILTGYGGFGISQTPDFAPSRLAWLEQGGVLAIATLRGGGEFGEDWHRAGMLTHKQNVFDDFAACARALIDQKYTRPERLAIQGGSNGGLLMGAALTQHPDLYRAVVSRAGIYDMLRVELSTNGFFNTTEYGTVKDPDQFAALDAYSPYHHVKDGTPYPAVLFTTGLNDPRVDPMQSRKMLARLQAASSSGRPILLRTSGTSGHGLDTPLSQRIVERADVFAFLCHELGVEVKPVGSSASR